jgi:hypothetical protein
MGLDSERNGNLTRALLCGIGLLWLVGLGVGLRTMLNYEDGPATSGSPPGIWPSESRIQRALGLPAIVVMAHPRCPCTRATIGELALLMARLQKRATATVVFVLPSGVPEKWEETDLWHDAQQIPGVRVMNDPEGKEAALFGAQASGQTVLYDAEGKLQFSGGITSSRGHSGDNAGRSAIVELVTSGRAEQKQTPVYGCYLHGPEIRAEKGDEPWTSQPSSKRK